MSPERKFEKRLVELAKKHGWYCRKVKWIGRRGAPDRLLISDWGRRTWIELNSPGKKPDKLQEREHAEMRKFGENVRVIDSMEGVEALFA